MSGNSRLNLPVRKRSYRFALTPLADAMFQLLIFFMLSSSLTPYSLLTLQSASGVKDEQAAPGEETTASDVPEETAEPGDVALWTVEAGSVLVGGQSFGFDALSALAGALGTPSAPADVILVVRTTAQVQDIATVLEALQAANVASVQVSTGAI